MRERTHLNTSISRYKDLEAGLDDAITLIELGEMEGEEEAICEGEAALDALSEEAGKLELESLLSGEADANDCYV